MPSAVANFRFYRTERIKSSSTIQEILEERRSCSAFPLKCYYRFVPKSEASVQVAFVVSKRRFKHAVDRNRVKRLMRESFRLQKHLMPADEQCTLQMCWIYVGVELLDYQAVYKAGGRVFQQLSQQYPRVQS
jgi:ribonuclease P protein component, eubacterial